MIPLIPPNGVRHRVSERRRRVAAVQAVAQANADFAAAAADYNRAQFRLYRALGHPPAALRHAVPNPVRRD
jgi:hypothetical protein